MTRLSLKEYGWAIGIIGAATGIALALRPYLQTIDVAMLYLLAVVVIAYRHRRGPALLASVLSIAVFDYGFVPPFYTFNVHNTAFFLTFVVMLVVAMGMSELTGRIREQAEEAAEGEQLAAAQYTLSRELAAASSLDEEVAIAARHISEAGEGEALMLLSDPTGSGQPGNVGLDAVDSVTVRVAARMALEQEVSAGWGTTHGAEAEALVVPLMSSTRVM